MNVAEVYAGMRAEEEARTEEFLGALRCLSVDLSAAKRAGRLKSQWAKKGRTLSLADTIVAAVAVEHDCTLVTDNRKDFPMPEVQLSDVPE